MADVFPPEKRSQIMRAVRGKDTTPERVVRRVLYALGYRYRLHANHLPGKPDLVMPGRRVAIFVHGCFWHQHHCPRGDRRPKSNTAYWTGKLQTNRRRDRRHQAQLRRDGWRVLVIWECQIGDPDKLARRLQRFLERDVDRTKT